MDMIVFTVIFGVIALFVTFFMALGVLVQFIILAPVAYVFLFGFVVIITLVVAIIRGLKNLSVSLTAGGVIFTILLVPVVAHYIRQPLTKECSVPRDVMDITVEEKGSHYVMGIWTGRGTGHIKQYDFDADHLIPINTSRDIEFQLLGVVDNRDGYFPRFTAWVVENHKVIVSVIQGQQKDTIEMSSEDYSDIIYAMEKGKEADSLLRDAGIPASGKSDIERSKSNFRQDIERAKNI